ncbi:hypothetical protein GCM10009119_31260 [Algoriphagus jejuensis]|uniref:Uncharacterized protein n=1 Tax=Algoriphagus jejuensis TaxID=419934 RepID=A0ABP3YFN3_9BACT
MSLTKISTVAFFSVFALFLLGYTFKQNEKKIVHGDLAFVQISYTNLYGISDSLYQALEEQIDKALASPEHVDQNELDILRYFDKRRKHNLLRKPQILLRKADGTYLEVYLPEDEYAKVRNFRLRELIQEGLKVSLTLQIETLDSALYYSDQIIELKVVDGQTYPDVQYIDRL